MRPTASFFCKIVYAREVTEERSDFAIETWTEEQVLLGVASTR